MTSSRSRNSKGFTLVELMVVIAVLSIVLGLVYSIFISQMQTSVWRGQIADRQQNLKGAINIMIGDLLSADSLVNATDAAAGRFMCANAVAIDIDGETITYYKSPTAGTGNLIRSSTTAARTAVVAENITSVSFKCFDRIGQEMSSVNGTSASEVRQISITLSGETAKARPGTATKSENTITSSVELRNVPQTAGHGCGILYFELNPKKAAFCDSPGQSPETRPQISIKLCDLEGKAVGGTVKIFPKEPQPVIIDGQFGTVVDLVDNISVMTMPDNTGKMCSDPTVTWGTAIVNASDPAALAAGTGMEMVSVWKPTGCTYEISTSRSLSVEAGKPYNFVEDNVIVNPMAINACQSDTQANLEVTVIDNCGHPLSGKNVQFDVYDAEPPAPAGSGTGVIVTGQPEWGVIGPVTDNNDGTYSAVYNAGSVARNVYLVASSSSIAMYNTTNSAIKNTITLNAHYPHHLVGIAPIDNSMTVENCINNSGTVTFEVRDQCDNIVTQDQAPYLSSTTTDAWALAKGGGMQGITRSGDRYSTIYNTSTSDCGGTAGEYINIYHNQIGDAGADMSVDLNLVKCSYPGVTLSVEPLTVAAGCPDESVQVTAQVLIANATGECQTSEDPSNITFEVKNVGASGVLLTDYAQTGTRNGRFLDETGNILTNPATRVKSTAATPGTAITNLIAYDAIPDDKLYVRATADIPPYGNAEYSKEYANPIVVTNSSSTLAFFTDSTFSTEASLYDLPGLLPSPSTGSIFMQVRDCDSNGDIAIINTVSVDLKSFDFSGNIDTLAADLTESNNNTGIFNGEVFIKRVAEPGVLLVNSGGIINATYVDPDDVPIDQSTDSVSLGGCRYLKIVDALDSEIGSIVPDIYPYDLTYPDGQSAFHLKASVPEWAGDGNINSAAVQMCANGESKSVTLTEEPTDNGILRIQHQLFMGDYVYVGEDPGGINNVSPTPDADDGAGLRVISTPSTITVVGPETSPACNILDPEVVNGGCWDEVAVGDVDPPVITEIMMPAGPLQGIVTNFSIKASDGSGTIKDVDLVFICSSGPSCSVGTEYVVFSASPNSSTYNSLLTDYFDSSLIPDGTYTVEVRAVDDANQVGTAQLLTTREVNNACTIENTSITRDSSDHVRIGGVYKLNSSPSSANPVTISLTDGNSMSYGPFTTTASGGTGAFSWTSSLAHTAPVTTQIQATHGNCTATLTISEQCGVTVSESAGILTATYELNGVTHMADVLGIYKDAAMAMPIVEQNNVSSFSWTYDPVAYSGVTIWVGGQFGMCSPLPQSLTLP